MNLNCDLSAFDNVKVEAGVTFVKDPLPPHVAEGNCQREQLSPDPRGEACQKVPVPRCLFNPGLNLSWFPVSPPDWLGLPAAARLLDCHILQRRPG